MVGKKVGQVCCLFSLNYILPISAQNCMVELAYVDWFQLIGTSPHPDHGMYEIAKKMRLSNVGGQVKRDGSVISIDDIIRGVHLIPKFGKGPTCEGSLNQVLEGINHYYINNYIDHY